MQDTSTNIPPTSCRAGKVVHLLNENSSQVPVKIKIRTVAGEDGVSTLQVVQASGRAALTCDWAAGPN